jgi:hypothetical protein
MIQDAAKIATDMHTMHRGVEGADKIEIIRPDGVIGANVNWLD